MITAYIEPLLTEDTIEDIKERNPIYKTLEIQMQKLGHLVPFREQLNWSTQIETIELGENDQLKSLQKLAAKSDGGLLFYLKLTKKTIFQNLLLHPNNKGLYLPFRFDYPFPVVTESEKLWIGSAPRLRDELNWLEMSIQDSSTEDTKHFWQSLREVCESAIDHTSPFLLKN